MPAVMTTECSVACVPNEERKEQTFSPASSGAIAFLPLQNNYCADLILGGLEADH